MVKIDNPDWTERYRPHTIDDVILPERHKSIFKKMVEEKSIPESILLIGPPGVGKTTLARAMLDEIDCDYIVINGSLEGNIDTLRNKIGEFASSVSFKGGRKVVLIDEADYISSQLVQPALRNFMESHSKNCTFILTANYKKKIMPELRSRCSEINFDIKKTEKNAIVLAYFTKLCEILDKENVKYDKKVLADLIIKFFPDFRKVIHECQLYSKTGKIDSGLIGAKIDFNIKELMVLLKAKNYRNTAKWVTENSDSDPLDIMRRLYDNAYDIMVPLSVQDLVILIAEYQYKHAFVADQEVNLLAFLANVMKEIEWL